MGFLTQIDVRVNYSVYEKIAKIVCFLILLPLTSGCTNEASLKSTFDCDQMLINKYVSYRVGLLNGKDLSDFFNKDFFIKKMKHANIPEKEYADRVLKYMEGISVIQKKVKKLSGFYAECGNDVAKLLIETKLFKDNENQFYFVIMFVDGKAVNISEDYLPSAKSYFNDFHIKPINYSFE